MLTASQEQFWNALKGPEFYCHQRARAMLIVRGRGKKFHGIVDESLRYIIANFSKIDGIRIMHTWLRVYELPIDPNKLTSYDEFHNHFGKMIADMSTSGQIGSIKPY
jgi:hypothetical protein